MQKHTTDFKKFKKIGLEESISIHLQTPPIYHVKFRNEEGKDKARRELINVEGVNKRRLNIRSVTQRALGVLVCNLDLLILASEAE